MYTMTILMRLSYMQTQSLLQKIVMAPTWDGIMHMYRIHIA